MSSHFLRVKRAPVKLFGNMFRMLFWSDGRSALEIKESGKTSIVNFDGYIWRSSLTTDPINLTEELNSVMQDLRARELYENYPSILAAHPRIHEIVAPLRKLTRIPLEEIDVIRGGTKLKESFQIMRSEGLKELPVAAFTTLLYYMETYGVRDLEFYNEYLLPGIDLKLKYIHIEGLYNTIWALISAQMVDHPLFSRLLEILPHKETPMDYEFVSFKPFCMNEVVRNYKRSYQMERKFSQFGYELFYQSMSFYLYNIYRLLWFP